MWNLNHNPIPTRRALLRMPLPLNRSRKRVKQLTHRPVNTVDGRLEIGNRKLPSERRPSSKTSTQRKAPVGALPPARAFVLMKLGQTVKGLFPKQTQAENDAYARKTGGSALERIQGGHQRERDCRIAVQVRQFCPATSAGHMLLTHAILGANTHLLSQSLNRDLREDTLGAILSRELSASQIANLTNIELASASRLDELEAAKQASLASTVKSQGTASSDYSIR